MEIRSERWGTGAAATISTVACVDEGGEDFGFIIEDQYQDGPKVPGETCIPAGRYRVELRTDSPKFARYYEAEWSRDWYRGMPWLQDVPGFSFIYAHPGENDDHSDGCLITGEEYRVIGTRHWIIKGGTSRPAFKRLCLAIYAALDRGEDVWWTVNDDQLVEGGRR